MTALLNAGHSEATVAGQIREHSAAVVTARNNLRELQGQLAGVQGELRQTGGAAQSAGSQVEGGMNRGVHATAGMTREVIVLAHEFVSGNFSRIPGSIMVLTERLGGLGTITTALKGPFGIATAGALALGGGLAYVALQAYRAEQALRGVYNANLLAGGTSARGAEAGARAGAEALRQSGIMSGQAASDYAAAVYKMRDLSDQQKQTLITLGGAIYVASGRSDQAAAKFVDNFGKETAGLKQFITEYGLATTDQAEAVAQATNADQLRSIALATLQQRLSGATAALKTAQTDAEQTMLNMA
jgi:hypothetical protein